ncbi:MAG: helix-turn-helix domain-containing protein [Lachnospiraceae bacterium]
MTINDLQNIIIDNINTLLVKRKDISLKSLSHAIGTSDSYMQKLMSGKCVPTLDKLIQLSNYFEVPVHTLLTPNTPTSQEVQIMMDKLSRLSPEAVHLTHDQIDYMISTENKARNNKRDL